MKRRVGQFFVALIVLAWVLWMINGCIAYQRCKEVWGPYECGFDPSVW